jgi:hypothetical protein
VANVTSTVGNIVAGNDDYEGLDVIQRYFGTFSIPSGNTIVSATIHFYVTSLFGGPTVSLGANLHNFNLEAFDTGDWWNSTLHGTLDSNNISFSTTGWKTLTVNASGLTNINNARGGSLTLCLREYDHDILNSQPGTDEWWEVIINTGDHTNKPYITLNY